ncbi:MAG: hypothetical protein AAFQ90_09530, partial [Pseudomonadota bacterium]
ILMIAPLIYKLGRGAVVDGRPPIVWRHAQILSGVIPRGGEIRYRAQYIKRAGCHPPKGRGDIAYRLYVLNAEGRKVGTYYQLIIGRVTQWPATSVFKIGEGSAIAGPHIPRGRYLFQWLGAFDCVGAETPLLVAGPLLPVEIGP